jgi:thiamine pyrophosphate-dependent acetolactate synthase large subunit-like protein
LILAGGGVIASGAEKVLAQVAGTREAGAAHGDGQSVLPADHPLAAGLTWHRATSDLSNMASFFTPLLEQADGLLAIGCRFSQLASGSWTMPRPARVGADRHRCPGDRPALRRHAGVCSDAAVTLRALLSCYPHHGRRGRNRRVRPEPWRLPGLDLLAPMRRVLPRDDHCGGHHAARLHHARRLSAV